MKSHHFKIFNQLLAALALASTIFIPANAQSQDTNEGIVLYNQLKTTAAIPFLRKSADSGDSESQYYLGEALRKKNGYITPEASTSYESAAKSGNLYAMIRLGETSQDLCSQMKRCTTGSKASGEWNKEAKTLAQKKAADGDSEAMYILYLILGDDDWLEKSAQAGYAPSQFLLGNKYREGKGFFVMPSGRSATIARWMKASAEGGYPQGMMAYAAELYENNDLAGYRYWNEKAAEAGYPSAVYGLGINLSKKNSEYGFSTNLIKSYALLELLTSLDGGGGMDGYAKNALPNIMRQMSESDITQGKIFSEQWKSSHPPLSFFPPKLSY